MKRLCKTNTIILSILLFLSSGVFASAQPLVEGEKKILVLFSGDDQLTWVESLKQGMQKARLKYGKAVQFYIEYMEEVRLANSLSDPEWAAHLAKKYHSIQFDAAIADGPKATLFLRHNGQHFLGNIPHVYHSANPIAGNTNSRSLTTNFRTVIEKTLQMAVQQNSDAQQVVIIDGKNSISRNFMKILLPLLANYPQLKVTVLKDYSVAELKEKLSRVASNSIVFYNLVFKDKTGKEFVPEEVLAELAEIANAPIYSFGSLSLGSGTVGGHMNDGELNGLQMVTAAMDYLEYGTFKASYPRAKTIFDWQALSKYGIDPDTVPENATFINKPVPLLESHFKEMLQLCIVMLIILFLLTLYWIKKLAIVNHKLKIANKEVGIAKNRAEQLARTDYLSGMNNRRAFFDKSEQVLIEVKRNNNPFSLLMIDIDHFKKVNDNYGHAIGDQIIKSVAQIIKQVKREVDISARFGGEEFVILSPATDISGAAIFAERIRKEIQRSVYHYSDIAIKITVSIGVYSPEKHSAACSLQDYISHADDALYRAKERGRNQVAGYPKTR